MRIFAAATAILLLAACTTSHTMLVSSDEAILSVQSHNSLLGVDAVATRTLQEAAKLTVSRGYRYFRIFDVQNTSRTISVFVPGSSYSSGTATAFGNTASYNGTTTYQPARVVNGQWIGDRVRVKMFADGAPEASAGGIYDATFILARH